MRIVCGVGRWRSGQRAEGGGEKGEVTFSLRRRSRRSFAPPFPPSRPQAIPAAADFLFGTFSFVRW